MLSNLAGIVFVFFNIAFNKHGHTAKKHQGQCNNN